MRLTPVEALAGDLATGLALGANLRTRGEPANPRTREPANPRTPRTPEIRIPSQESPMKSSSSRRWRRDRRPLGLKHHRGSEAAEMARGSRHHLAGAGRQSRPGGDDVHHHRLHLLRHQARGWLADKGFAFTECNMSVDRRCGDEFRAYKANGTPFLVIRRGGRTHEMHEGFDSEEFLAALRG